jgi:hypothetical protein
MMMLEAEAVKNINCEAEKKKFEDENKKLHQ